MTRARDMANLGSSAATLETTVANKSGKNLIINGAMQVAQRSTSTASVTSGGYHACDRWNIFGSSFGTYTVSQSSTSPDGFANSLKLECTAADASPSAGDHFGVQQKFEGQNLQQLKKGTSGAVSTTVSFWVRSSKTGTYTLEMDDRDNTRSFSKTYTINAADTWEHKSVTFAGDTTGALDDDNANSFNLSWWLVAGTTFTGGTFTTGWESRTNGNRVSSSNVNLSDSTSNDWYLTGVQLEVGSTDTPYSHRFYVDELNDCFRYFNRYRKTNSYGEFVTIRTYSATQGTGIHQFPTPMRAAPSLSIDKTVNSTYFAYNLNAIAITGTDGNGTSCGFHATSASSSFVSGGGAVIQSNAVQDISFNLDAEL